MVPKVALKSDIKAKGMLWKTIRVDFHSQVIYTDITSNVMTTLGKG
jgi:hypothetical protein